jgi:uncharacterized membrane protein
MGTAAHYLEVNVPADRAYSWWRGLTNLPAVMPEVESVDPGDNPQLSRWQVRTRAGGTVECLAKITEDVPNQRIAWRRLDEQDAGVPSAGMIRFDDHGGSTGVEVSLQYIGERPDPQQRVERTLSEFKRRIESEPVQARHVERI